MLHNTRMYNVDSIADRLKLLMERANVPNETWLAEQTKVPQPTVHRVLTGESKEPKLYVLKALAGFLGVTVSQLIGERPIDDDDKYGHKGLQVAEQTPSYLPGTVLSRSIMGDVIKVVTEELIMKGKTLPPKKMEELMLLIHDEIQESEQQGKKLDKAKIVKLIKLAA